LKTAFGINETLNPTNAKAIYDKCNDLIANDPKFTPQGLMNFYNVEVVCTTDDPVDTLEWHDMVAADKNAKTRMIPAWRPDAAMNIEAATWKAYIEKLSKVSDTNIATFADLIAALQKRHDFFASKGCKLSDHGIEEFYDEPYTNAEIDAILGKALSGQTPSVLEQRKFKHAFLKEMAIMDYNAGWTQQYHYGAIRNNNTKMFNKLGADTGFDSIGEFTTAKACSHFLDELNVENKLTKTILYNLNPCANEVIATMLGNFQDGSCPGKIQFGSGWWFLDQKDGMEKQMNALSLLGLLSRFVGMLTDSRSFLSYPRHEYFRRTLCNLVGNDVENGLIPYTGYEKERVQQMIEDICYNNAKGFFNF
jgi:glucuronate isomerase